VATAVAAPIVPAAAKAARSAVAAGREASSHHHRLRDRERQALKIKKGCTVCVPFFCAVTSV
jgi:hypothetical protein